MSQMEKSYRNKILKRIVIDEVIIQIVFCFYCLALIQIVVNV